jgi:Pyruvate/2-oxoacid:ferredoxin oxidoreductase gamma subunit
MAPPQWTVGANKESIKIIGEETDNAHKVARECNMGGRINTIMQTCFFAISGVLGREQAIAAIKDSIRKT